MTDTPNPRTPQPSTEAPLVTSWRALARRASRWQSGDDPEPVLEALAMSTALELVEWLGQAPRDEREALRRLGQRALLQLGGRELDEDDLEALRMCAALARDGLRALSGRALEPSVDSNEQASPEPRDLRVVIPAADVTRLLAGELDGFRAAALAMKLRRSAAARGELSALLRLRRSNEERSLTLAAAGATPVLDPAEGRRVGALGSLGAEAVLFEATDGARRLAVYAEEPDAVRLLAAELTTEDVREGYWVGRLAEGVSRLEATLEIGDRAETWTLDLSDLEGS